MLNQAHTSDRDSYYNRERPSIQNLVPPGRHRILDLGCGAGVVGRRLVETGKAAELVGVELFAEAAKEAARHYAHVHQGDIEAMELPYGAEFDVVICGDILEHLKDPYAVVRRVHGWLRPGGHFISSVPNIRNWQVITDLAFRGNWTYVDAGIMDRTHLRFFTRKSCHAMLREAGLSVVSTTNLISGRKFNLLNRLTLRLLVDLFGSQLVVLSRKSS